jgi:hypothetical protein
LTLPEDFYKVHFDYNTSQDLTLGHYYYCNIGGRKVGIFDNSPGKTHAIIHPLTYEVETVSKGALFRPAVFRCVNRYRILVQVGALEDLARRLDSAKKAGYESAIQPQALPDPSIQEPSSPPTREPKVRSGESPKRQPEPRPFTPEPTEPVGDSAERYEQFQKKVNVYFDKPSEDVSVASCDKLIEEAKGIDIDIQALLIDVGSQRKSNEVRIVELENRVKETSNPQVRDRIKCDSQ